MTKLSRRVFLSAMAVASGCATWGLHSNPAQAYQVMLLPASPQLGDTLSILIITEDATENDKPVVSIGNNQYPSFRLSRNRFRAFIPTSPLESPGKRTIQVTQAGVMQSHNVTIRDRWFRTQYITLPPGSSDLGTDHEFDRVAEFKQLVTPERHWQGPLLRPSSGYVSTEFGVQRYYNGVFAEDYYHRGVDYSAATGSSIVAPAAGHIRLVGRVQDGFEIHGNTVGIDHGQGVLSIMIHMHRIDVQEGEFVAAGQTVGGVGSTGASTGPHLHWGLYVNGIAVDPVPWRFEGVE
ncbi:MAG: M23 family metallopeptidase [Phormidesmis sp.]